MNTNNFYSDKPVFGLDIGFQSMKVMQIEPSGKRHQVVGYGAGNFNPEAIKEGVIVDPSLLANSAMELFEQRIIGDISTRRVVVGIPASRTFTRIMKLPKMKAKDREEAVRLEAEQYIPVSVDQLYLDYEIIGEDQENQELLVVAAPQRTIDSYMDLMNIMGLEAVAFEPSTMATSRLVIRTDASNTPSILIDFGSVSTDLTVLDKNVLVTGTVQGGGDNVTELISKKLGVSPHEAHVIKVKYGLDVSKKQTEIREALEPQLKELVKEIRRVIRYYDERSGSSSKISQIITMGGGANMPGLSAYLTDTLRLPVRMCDPWDKLDFGGLRPPDAVTRSTYITVAGLAMINPEEIFSA